MIPKKIHYCWFGRGDKPQIMAKCIASWKQFCPDFEIVEWNEDNFNIDKYLFARQAYDCKKFAFVSDVARLHIVYENGGIYLDTDVELKAPLDEFINDEAFLFFPNAVSINTGLGFGGQAGNAVIKAILDDYENREFCLERMAEVTCPVLNTAALKRTVPAFQISNVTQKLGQVSVYSSGVYDLYAEHHDQFSWMSAEHRKALRYARKNPPNRAFWKHFRNPKIFAWFDRHGLKKLKYYYLFAVYDFVEYGPVYWGYKVIQKIKKKVRL